MQYNISYNPTEQFPDADTQKIRLRIFVQFILIIIAAGAVLDSLIIPVFIILAVVMYNKGFFLEIFLTLYLILTLSDSALSYFRFAASLKPVYIIMLLVPFFYASKELKFSFTSRFHLYFLPFYLFALYCVYYSPVPLLSIQKASSYYLLFLVVPIYLIALYKKYGIKLIKYIVYVGVAALVACVLLRIINPGHAIYYHTGRGRGIFANPNGLGMYSFVFLVFFHIVKHHYPSLFKKKETILIYLLAGFTLIWSGSRGQTLAAIIFLSSQYLFQKNFILGLLVSLFMLAVAYTITIDIGAIANLLGIQDFVRVETVDQGGGRVIAHNFAWEHIELNYWMGKGFGYTEYLFHLPENEALFIQLGHVGNSHNAFLTVWLDTGLIGLILFALGWILIFIQASKYSKLILPLAFALISSNMVESWLIGSLNPFTIQIVTLLIIIIHFQKERGTILKGAA